MCSASTWLGTRSPVGSVSIGNGGGNLLIPCTIKVCSRLIEGAPSMLIF